jgi:hypothetical protein
MSSGVVMVGPNANMWFRGGRDQPLTERSLASGRAGGC